MGVDIEMYAEHRCCTEWFPSHLDETSCPVIEYDTGNSSLFAILADIDNDGSRFGEPYAVIASPRGLPLDLSPEVRALFATEGNELWSWLLLSELLDFDWRRRIHRVAAVEPRFAPLFQPVPTNFPFDRWPKGEQIIYSPWGLEEDPKYQFNRRGRVRVTWTETYAESAGSLFMDGLLPRLKGYGDPESVRIVFGFDW